MAQVDRSSGSKINGKEGLNIGDGRSVECQRDIEARPGMDGGLEMGCGKFDVLRMGEETLMNQGKELCRCKKTDAPHKSTRR